MDSKVIRNLVFWKLMREEKESLVNVFLESMTEDQQAEFVGGVVKLSKLGIRKLFPLLEDISKVADYKTDGDSLSIEGENISAIVEEAAKCGVILNSVGDGFEVFVVAEQEDIAAMKLAPKGLPEIGQVKKPEVKKPELAKKPEEKSDPKDFEKFIEALKSDPELKKKFAEAMGDDVEQGVMKKVIDALGNLPQSLEKALAVK